jgi:hypothetical protein
METHNARIRPISSHRLDVHTSPLRAKTRKRRSIASGKPRCSRPFTRICGSFAKGVPPRRRSLIHTSPGLLSSYPVFIATSPFNDLLLQAVSHCISRASLVYPCPRIVWLSEQNWRRMTRKRGINPSTDSNSFRLSGNARHDLCS